MSIFPDIDYLKALEAFDDALKNSGDSLNKGRTSGTFIAPDSPIKTSKPPPWEDGNAHGGKGEDEWEYVEKTHVFKVFRRLVPKSGLYAYSSIGILQGISPQTCYEVLLDLEYRKEWDQFRREARVIGSGLPPAKSQASMASTIRSEAIRWQVRMPWPMRTREYVYWREGREIAPGELRIDDLEDGTTGERVLSEEEFVAKVDEEVEELRRFEEEEREAVKKEEGGSSSTSASNMPGGWEAADATIGSTVKGDSGGEGDEERASEDGTAGSSLKAGRASLAARRAAKPLSAIIPRESSSTESFLPDAKDRPVAQPLRPEVDPTQMIYVIISRSKPPRSSSDAHIDDDDDDRLPRTPVDPRPAKHVIRVTDFEQTIVLKHSPTAAAAAVDPTSTTNATASSSAASVVTENEDHRDNTIVYMNYYDDPKGGIPSALTNYYIRTAFPGWLRSMVAACKKYAGKEKHDGVQELKDLLGAQMEAAFSMTSP